MDLHDPGGVLQKHSGNPLAKLRGCVLGAIHNIIRALAGRRQNRPLRINRVVDGALCLIGKRVLTARFLIPAANDLIARLDEKRSL